MAKPKVVGFTPERGRRIRKQSGGVHTSVVLQDTRPRNAGGSSLRFFRLLEDVTGNGAFYAKRTTRANATPTGDFVQVYNWDGLLSGALSGFYGLFGRVDGEWVFAQSRCVVGCVSAGVITVGTAPDGIAGTEYAGHTVTNSGITADTLSAGDLPPGLTMNGSGVISGTPTTAGTYYATITGTAPTVPPPGNCTLTRILKIIIAPAAE